jgi:hypothetical protein
VHHTLQLGFRFAYPSHVDEVNWLLLFSVDRSGIDPDIVSFGIEHFLHKICGKNEVGDRRDGEHIVEYLLPNPLQLRSGYLDRFRAAYETPQFFFRQRRRN